MDVQQLRMRRENFVDGIQTRANLNSEQRAREAADATLRTLGERINPSEADSVADRVPKEFEDSVVASDRTEDPFPESFVGRVALREEVTAEEAGHHARAVLVTLEERLGGDGAETGSFDGLLPHERGGFLDCSNWEVKV